MPLSSSHHKWILAGCAIGVAGCLAHHFFFRRQRKRRCVLQLFEKYDVKVLCTERAFNQWAYSAFGMSDETFPTCVIGFDTEWQEDGKVSIVQISTGSHCAVLQLLKMDRFPPLLQKLLECPNVLKLGVGVTGDARKILRDWGIAMAGTVELSRLCHARQVLRGRGLKAMCSNILYFQYTPEMLSCTRSKWEKKQLSRHQIQYAATDAIVGFQVAVSLLGTTPGARDTAGHKVDKSFHTHPELFQFCLEAVGAPELLFDPVSHPTDANATASFPLPPRHPPRLDKLAAKCSRKRPLYENVPVHSPEGRFIAMCQKKKVAKELIAAGVAVVHTEAPLAIRMTIEVGEADDFHKSAKGNMCARCGSKHSLNKHHVVPVSYYKSLKRLEHSHDTLLLCGSCSFVIQPYVRAEMQRIAVEFNCPIDGHNSKQNVKDRPEFKAKQYSKTILANILTNKRLLKSKKDKKKKSGEEESGVQDIAEVEEEPVSPSKVGTYQRKQEQCIYRMDVSHVFESFERLSEEERHSSALYADVKFPRHKLEEFLRVISEYMGVNIEELTLTHLKECLSKQEESLLFVPHAEMVVRLLDTPEKINEFIFRWRRLFVKAATPRSLPEHWREDYLAPDSVLLRLINALDLTPFPVHILPSGLPEGQFKEKKRGRKPVNENGTV